MMSTHSVNEAPSAEASTVSVGVADFMNWLGEHLDFKREIDPWRWGKLYLGLRNQREPCYSENLETLLHIAKPIFAQILGIRSGREEGMLRLDFADDDTAVWFRCKYGL